MKLYLLLLSVLLAAGLNSALPVTEQRVETDPELTAGYVEGDMVLDVSRNGLKNTVYRWPNNTVYYKFFTALDDDHHNHILRGMQMLEEVSCLRFVEADEDQPNYINITAFSGGCYSSVGYRGSVQTLNLQIYPIDTGCYRLGTIVHEFLHSLGFYHMQSASNRDEYVYIAEENITEGSLHNFNLYNDTIVDDFDQEYDYGSVLHYSAYAFSSNGQMTIVPLKEEEASGIMGQRRAMSASDINKLNVMYRCPVSI